MNALLQVVRQITFSLLLAVAARAAVETSFWVWHRSSPLCAQEIAVLKQEQVHTLYWHVGELAVRDGAWHWTQPPLPLPVVRGIRVVPVVRFDPAGSAALAPAAPLILERHLAELKIDYDCPDRRLAEYAQFLHQVRKEIPALTITALAGWIEQPAFREVMAAVTEVAPMFYDLEPDPLREKIPQPLPLLDPQKVSAQLKSWSRCPIPWRAGLPNFARITIYDSLGKSRGHLRSWNWDDVCFDRHLALHGPTSLGVTLFQVLTDHQLAVTALQKKEWLAARWPEREALARAVSAAEKQGARGVTFFRLPDGTAAGGWSLSTLARVAAGEAPQLVLRKTAEQNLCLTNDSAIDLVPRFGDERGYALELDAPAPADFLVQQPSRGRIVAHGLAPARTRCFHRVDSLSQPALFNLLHDLHDAFAIAAPKGELAACVRWRFQHADWFGLSWQNDPIERRRYGEEPKVPGEKAVEIEKQLAAASPTLRPQWLTCGARSGQKRRRHREPKMVRARARGSTPVSAGAENALFMDARCQISRSRTYSSKMEDMEAAAADRPRARELFGRYLEKYPRGILAADALGWLGAIAYDSGEYAAALRYYITQTELPGHPEIRPSALLMCEKTLSYIASAPNDEALYEVALHPRVAMGLIYLIVNTTEADNFNGEEDDPAAVRKWRQEILPRLAGAVAKEKRFFRDPVWQPRFLAILAYAASGVGRQEEALKLSESAVAQPARSDDLLFARAVAMQRAGKFGEAIAAYQEFTRTFPKSPLARGAQLRLGLTLQDNHQAGAAILALEELDAPNEPPDYSELPPPDLSGAEPAQVKQLIDTLRNFAPLPELAEVVRRTELDPARRIEFNETLAQRYLAREDFAEAQKYLTPAQWSLTAGRIESLTTAANAAKNPAERARLCAETGDAWAAHGDSGNSWEDERRWEPIICAFSRSEHEAAEWELPRFQAEVADLALQAHALQRTINAAFWINYLDDLQTFLQEPDPGAAVRARYVALRAACMRQSVWGYWPGREIQRRGAGRCRRESGRPRREVAQRDHARAGRSSDGKSARLPGFSRSGGGRESPHPGALSRDAGEGWRAVSFQDARLSAPGKADREISERVSEKPEARSGDALARASHFYGVEAGNGLAGNLLAGERTMGLRGKGAVAARQRAWAKALELTLAQLHDAAHPSLQSAAQDRLDQLFVRLGDPQDRAELLRAIKASAPARAALGDFLKRAETENPLAELKEYLTAQLAEVP